MTGDVTLPTWPLPDARSLARAIPAHFTPQQQRVVEAVRDSGAHLMVRATAGSGKTTTLVEAAWHLPDPGRAAFFAYNRHAAAAVAGRLPPGMASRTMHAHGLTLLHRTGKAVDLQAGKTAEVLRSFGLLDMTGPAVLLQYARNVAAALVRAWDLYRELTLSARRPDDVALLLAECGWPELPEDPEDAALVSASFPENRRDALLTQVLDALQVASVQAFTDHGTVDFTDMLWLPLQLGLGRGGVRVALVDEAQDLTPLRQAFVTHVLGLRTRMPGRLILCGDPEQAIYAYAGADAAGMARLAREHDAVELPLSVSFRCPRAVVAVARTVSDFIQPAPTAAPGEIEHVPADTCTFVPGDVVLCRSNAPLVRLALRLLTEGVSVHVTGKDLQDRASALVTAAFPRPFRAEDVDGLMQVAFDRRAATLQRAGDRRASRKLQDLRDLCKSVALLAGQAAGTGVGTAETVTALIRSLCRAQGDVTLTTVHKAKGLEWDRVTVLYPELMPLPSGDAEEERCVQFVAYTRAKQVLRFAYGQAAWDKGVRIAAKEEATRTEGEKPPVPVLPVPPPPASRPKGRPVRPAPPAPPNLGAWSSPPSPVGADVPAPAVHKGVADIWDDRETPLFGGPDVLSVVELGGRLGALAADGRPALRDWAAASLALLDGWIGWSAAVHGGVLRDAETAARLSRLAIPAFGAKGPAAVRVLVFEGKLARWRYAELVRRGPGMVTVVLLGETLRFDARRGELLGPPFTPLGMHLDPAALSAG